MIPKTYLKLEVLIGDSFNIESDSWDSCHNFSGLQSVQDRSFT